MCEALIDEAKLSGVQVKTSEVVGVEISGNNVTAFKVKVVNFANSIQTSEYQVPSSFSIFGKKEM